MKTTTRWATACALACVAVVLALGDARAACPVVGDVTANINGPHVIGKTDGEADNQTPSCASSSTAPDAIYVIKPPWSGQLTISVDHPGTSYNAVLHVRTKCNQAGSELACSDSPGTVTIDAVAGTNYYILVDGYGAAVGDFELSLTMTEQTCDDGVDNDNDGDTDCDDSDCAGLGDCAGACTNPPDITANINGSNVTGSTTGQANDGVGTCNTTGTAGDVIFSVTPPYDGPLTASLDNPGTNYDEILHVRTECADQASEVGCDDIPGEVAWDAVAGTTYFIYVDGWSTYEGNFELSLEMREIDCNDGVDNDGDGATDCDDVPDCVGIDGCPGPCTDPPDITGNINGANVTGSTSGADSNGAGTCNATGTAGDVIYAVTPAWAGQLTLSLDNPGTDYSELVHVRTTCHQQQSEVACHSYPGTVTIDAAGGTTYYVYVDGSGTAEGDYELSLTLNEGVCDDNVDNDGDGLTDCADWDCAKVDGCPGSCQAPIDISTQINAGPILGTTSGKSSSGTGSCNSTGTAGDVVYAVTPPYDGELTVSLDNPGTTYDEVLHVRTNCNNQSSEVDCNDTPGEVTFEATAGSTYFVFVDGYSANEGPYELTLTMRETACDDLLDNDLDGATDCDDLDCGGIGGCPASCVAPVVGTVTCTSDIDANTTQGSSSVLSGYDLGPCGGCCDQPNEELVYEFVPQADGSVTILLDGMSTDQDLYVLEGGCDPPVNCIAESDLASTVEDQVTFTGVAGTTYFVVVENYAAATGNDGRFSLHFDTGAAGGCLEDCDDGLDNDFDGDTDCADSDCASDPVCCGDNDGDSYAAAACGGDDCDDGDPEIHPGALEICNGVDDDCLATTWDGVQEPWFGEACDGPDADACTEGTLECTAGSQACSDATGDSPEVCDGADNDCDGSIDEGLDATWYLDGDGDGYGDADSSTVACAAPAGYVDDLTDCDDTDAQINPGAAEICNGVNDDCSATTADGSAEAWYGEACDGPDAGDCLEGTWACDGSDQTCSDTTGDDVEVCDGDDNDCDGQTDEGLLTTYYQDADGDGYGDADNATDACAEPPGYGTDASDCDDGDGSVHPGAAELCNGVDDDCSAATPDGSDEVWFGLPCDGPDSDACTEGIEACVGGAGPSCTDTTGDSTEVCDGLDNDCDGETDEEGALTTYYQDGDGDGFGRPDVSQSACSPPAGFVLDASDCDDALAAVHPGAPELCNTVDDDCDAGTPDGSAEDWWDEPCDGDDADECFEGALGCAGGTQACSDTTADNVEVCDGIDNDCDGSLDEGLLQTFYLDGDGDGFGSAGAPTEACAAPNGYVADATDCDDGDALVHPGAAEICNGVNDDCSATTADGSGEAWFDTPCDGGDQDLCEEGSWGCVGAAQSCSDETGDAVEACDGVDNDCDGDVDEDLLSTFYLDADTDGFGAADAPADACAPPAGHVDNALDCDDADGSVHPGATELCNDVDDDCSAATADGSGEAWFAVKCDGLDSDECEEGTFVCAGGSQSCSDATGDDVEVCDGVDNDCDGQTDEEGDLVSYFLDADGDGFGRPGTEQQACSPPAGYVPNDSDCDDTQPGISPAAAEQCNDVDDDCNPATADGSDELWWSQPCDGLDADQCAEGTWSCAGASQVCSDETGDAQEVCDGVDNDCNGATDEGLLTTFWLDADGDGFGAVASPTQACTQPAGHVADASDCEDADAFVHPGAAEVCNGVNDDCSAATADGSGEAWFGAACDGPDADLCAEGTRACVAGGELCTDETGDAVEVCDGLDNDCDGAVDEDVLPTWYQDADSDGYGNAAAAQTACAEPAGYVATAADCDDSDGSVHPGAVELCNGVNDDCSAATADGSGEAWLGDACDGADGDQCDEGTLSCVAGSPSCSDTTADTLEVCDGVDNDCDGDVDEAGDFVDWYVDGDGDGFGAPGTAVAACAPPDTGYVADGTDCDDAAAAVHPGAVELCNGGDDDCDAATADGSGEAWWGAACDGPDADACEEGTATCEGGVEGCSDTTGDDVEVCDGVDNDCDGTPDEDAPCDDGDPCTVDDVCLDGSCSPGAPNPCDDGLECTADSCDQATGCAHTPSDALCDDANACTEDACDGDTGTCQHAAIEGCCATADDCPTATQCFEAQCIAGACVEVPECLALEVCAFGACHEPCTPPKQTTQCGPSGETLFECKTDPSSGESAWIPDPCAGDDLCAFNQDADEFECCTPDCEDRECGVPSACMLSCGDCDSGWACAGPNESVVVVASAPDAFTCVPGCQSVAEDVPPEAQGWGVAIPECGPSLPGTIGLDACGGCDGYAACVDGVCVTACDEAGLTATGKCVGQLAQWCEAGKPQQIDCLAEGSYCCAADEPENDNDHAACCSCALECELKGWECGTNSCGEPCGDPASADGCAQGYDCQGHECVCTTPALCDTAPDDGPEVPPDAAADAGGGDTSLDVGPTEPETQGGGETASGCDCHAGPWRTGGGALGALLLLAWLLARRRRAAA